MAIRNHHTDIRRWMRDQFVVFDDFHYYVSGDLWTSLASDTNSSVAEDADGVGGILTINTGDNTNNNEAGVFTSNEIFLFAAGNPFYAEARIQYSEVNTSAANVAFGFADAAGADLLTDNGGGASINDSGALIYKVDGGTVWRANSNAAGGTASDSISLTTAGGSSYQILGIAGEAIDGSIDVYQLTYFVDNLPLRDSNNNVIRHLTTYTSATQMDFGVYCKVGAANTLTVNVDYLYCQFAR